MADISKITLPNGNQYNLKDAWARTQIEAITGGSAVVFKGASSTALTDGGNENPTVGGQAVSTKSVGDLYFYNQEEFIYGPDDKWHSLGSQLQTLGDLAYKSSATASYTPTGTVSQPTFSGASLSSTGSYTPGGSITTTTAGTENKTAAVSVASSGSTTYQPGGTISTPTITVTPSTVTFKPITSVGSTPSWTGTVSNENLTISWDAGSTPTQGNEQTVVTGISSATATQPTFSGAAVRLVTGNIAVPSSYTSTFTGTSTTVSVSGTPAGTVSQPTFSGTQATITVS